MTNFSNIKFDTKDVIKLVGGVGVLACMWYDLKTDLQVFKATTELRLKALEARQEKNKISYYNNREAVMPSESKIEGE